jgi:diacylglycerol O-acyltransferase / wax synthase
LLQFVQTSKVLAMKPLTGLDGMFLHLETPETPMHVGSVSLLDLPAGHHGDFLKDVQRLYARRIPLAPVLSRKLAELPLQLANPSWVQADSVVLEDHIKRVSLPRPGTMRQLEECVGRLHALPLDRSRPLWMVYIIDGLKSGQSAYYTKIHHAVLDGQAAVNLSRVLLDTSPKGRRLRSLPSKLRGEHPSFGTLAAAVLKHDATQYLKFMRGLPVIARTLASLRNEPGRQPATTARPVARTAIFGPRTPLNVAITGERGFAGVSLPLDEVKAIATAHDAKINDVVLALCAGALRHYLAEHGGLPHDPLLAAVPISLREAGNTEYSTQATMIRVSLATDISDPVKRLLAIRDAATAAKATSSRARPILPLDFPAIGTPWLLHGLAAIYGRTKLADRIPPLANLVISNVPGPSMPLYFAGARVANYWPLSIVQHGLGINITVESYAGALGVGITTASSAVPDPRQIAVALAAAHRELKRLTPQRRTVKRRTVKRPGPASKTVVKAR